MTTQCCGDRTRRSFGSVTAGEDWYPKNALLQDSGGIVRSSPGEFHGYWFKLNKAEYFSEQIHCPRCSDPSGRRSDLLDLVLGELTVFVTFGGPADKLAP